MTTITLTPRDSSDPVVFRSEEEEDEEESVTLHVDDSNSDDESQEENNCDNDDQASISTTPVAKQRIAHAVSQYELSASTDPAELQGFQRIADRLWTECQSFVIYAGVHLFDTGGHLTLGSRVSSTEAVSPPLTETRLVAVSESICHSVVLRDDDTENLFALKEITEGSVFYKSTGREALYAGYLLRNKYSVGVGVVCVLLNSMDAMSDLVECALTDASQEATHQLELRRLLMTKNRAAIQCLQEQNRILHHQLHSSRHGKPSKQAASSVVLPSFGVVSAVTTEDLMRHDHGPSRHWPLDTTSTTSAMESDSSTLPPRKPVRSAMLPMFHNENSANEQERSHLPDNYYAIADALNIDRTPVHKNDRQRVATLEALEIHMIQADEPTGVALKRVTDMAARLFECDYTEVSFLNHSKSYTIATHFSCSMEDKAKVCQFKPPLSVRADNGDPWLAAMDRGIAFCNYVAYTKRTFTLPDVSADETFAWAKDIKFYSASPIVVRGEVVASLCVADLRRAHPEFTAAHQIQQEQLAQLAAQHIENWVVQRELQRRLLYPEKTLDDSSTGKSIPPEYLAAVVFTGIQGSSALREANAVAMQEAVILHNDIMRECIADNHGYEIKSEGDSFQIVFHDCDDAVSFALQVQERLYEAPWGDEILGLPDGYSSAPKALRGLRVRMGLHYGPVTYQFNDVTGRHEYSGTTVNIAKSLEHMTYGGQITATMDVFESFHVTSTKLQVLDLGRHILLKGTHSQDGVIEKAVVQLVPSSLAFDYLASRTLKDDASSVDQKAQTFGRQFPPLLSLQRLSASFHEAPYARNNVTILCLSTKEVETFCMDPDIVLAALAKQIGTLLRNSVTNGYQCQDFVLAFATLSDAVSFGLTVQNYLRTSRVAGVHLAHLLAIGIHAGKFVSMGPHATTGHAEYKGTLVHKAARIAEAAKSGQVVVGMLDDEIPALSPELDSTYIGNKTLKDIPEEMDLHVCQWESESPQDE